ncbi:hypothetical protein TNCV_3418241 [Trichonephila clavipes]|nr:hypothetical protein TNCV_3418241 [Trichonephila clavipes]
MFDGLVAFAVNRWCHDCGARRLRVHMLARVTNEGRKVRSGCQKVEEFSQKKFFSRCINQIELRLELSDLSDDDNAANKTNESRILEGESSSDESDEEKHGNILNGKTILDHSLP